jgi:hypothetical protein
MQQLNSMRMPQVMRRKPAPDPSLRGKMAQLCACGGGTPHGRGSARRSRRTPVPAAVRPGPRSNRPRSTIPRGPSRPRDGDRPSHGGPESTSAARSDPTRSVPAPPGSKSRRTTIIARNRSACRSSGILPITATISSTVGGFAGYHMPLFRGGRPARWPGIAPATAADPSRRATPLKKTSLPPFESGSFDAGCSTAFSIPARPSPRLLCRSDNDP